MMRFFTKLGRGALWLGALVLTGAAALLAGRTILGPGDSGDEVAAEPLPAAVVTARYQNSYRQTRRFSGRIAPAQVVDAGFQVAGEIEAVLVETGDRVAKGEALARLDPARIELRRGEAEAQLRESEARLAQAEATLGRIDRLVGDGFATDQERDDAAAEREAARERVRLLRRSLARAGEDADDTVLRAPFDGYVVARYADAGTTVSPGQRVVRINESAALDAQIGVPMELARSLMPGDELPLSAEGRNVIGLVEGISEEVDPLTRSRLVRLRINDPGTLVPGSLVRLAMQEEREAQGAWVPITALQESYRGLWSVYVVEASEGGETVARKDVEIIAIGDDRAFVTGTIEDGDKVVSSSPFRFVPGQSVRMREAPIADEERARASSTLR